MTLIDGGLIANDPSLIAYMHANFNLKKPNIRVVSIGTGMSEMTKLDPDDTTLVTWIS